MATVPVVCRACEHQETKLLRSCPRCGADWRYVQQVTTVAADGNHATLIVTWGEPPLPPPSQWPLPRASLLQRLEEDILLPAVERVAWFLRRRQR